MKIFVWKWTKNRTSGSGEGKAAGKLNATGISCLFGAGVTFA